MNKASIKTRLPRNSKSIAVSLALVLFAFGIAYTGITGSVKLDIGFTEDGNTTVVNNSNQSQPEPSTATGNQSSSNHSEGNTSTTTTNSTNRSEPGG